MLEPKYKLIIDNFQGIKHTEISLDGFVSIQGETSCGKSSIRRALNALLFNDWEASYLSNTANQCTIKFCELETKIDEDDLELEYLAPKYVVEYTRTSNSVKYVLKQGKETHTFDKPGQTVPDAIKEVLGIDILDCDKESYNIHISRQQTVEPLFMIAFSEAQNTRILNRVFNVEKYEIAGQLCNKDIRNNKIQVNTITETVESSEKEVKEKEKLLKSVTKEADTINQYITKLETIETYMNRKSSLDIIRDEHKSIITKLEVLNQIDDINYKLTEVNAYGSGVKRYKETSNQIKELKAKIESIDKAEDINHKLKCIRDYDMLHTNTRAKKTMLKSYKETINRILGADVIVAKMEQLNKFVTKKKSIKELKEEIQSIDNNIEKVKQDLSEIKVCPLCNSTIEHSHLI